MAYNTGDYVPDYSINLDFSDLKSIDDSIKKLENYEKAFNRGIVNGVKRFEELATRKLRNILVKEGLGASNIMGGIRTEFIDDGVIIHVSAIDPDGTDYAIFLEYGVGMVGSGTGYPDLPGNWIYGSGTTIRPDGSWFYPLHEGDRGNVVAVFNGRPYGITKGYVGHKFMWQLYEYAKRQFKRTINQAIAKEIEKLGGSGK